MNLCGLKDCRISIMSESKNPNQPPFQEPRPQEPVSELEKGEDMSSSVPPMDAKEPLRLIGSFRIDPPDPELMSSEIAMRDHPLSAWDTSRSVTLPPTSEKRLEETVRPDVSEGEKGPDLAESAEIVLPSDPMIVGQDSPEIESAREMCRKHEARLAERKRKQQRAGEDGTQISGARQEESAAEDALWAERKRQEEEQKHFGEIAERERLQEKRSLEELQRRELDARLAELARREQEIRKAESAQKHENERLTALAQELGREERQQKGWQQSQRDDHQRGGQMEDCQRKGGAQQCFGTHLETGDKREDVGQDAHH